MLLGLFTETVFEMATMYSLEYKEEKRIVRNEPIISTADWNKGAVWPKDN